LASNCFQANSKERMVFFFYISAKVHSPIFWLVALLFFISLVWPKMLSTYPSPPERTQFPQFLWPLAGYCAMIRKALKQIKTIPSQVYSLCKAPNLRQIVTEVICIRTKCNGNEQLAGDHSTLHSLPHQDLVS
jgi:hypothetical protein